MSLRRYLKRRNIEYLMQFECGKLRWTTVKFLIEPIPFSNAFKVLLLCRAILLDRYTALWRMYRWTKTDFHEYGINFKWEILKLHNTSLARHCQRKFTLKIMKCATSAHTCDMDKIVCTWQAHQPQNNLPQFVEQN